MKMTNYGSTKTSTIAKRQYATFATEFCDKAKLPQVRLSGNTSIMSGKTFISSSFTITIYKFLPTGSMEKYDKITRRTKSETLSIGIVRTVIAVLGYW